MQFDTHIGQCLFFPSLLLLTHKLRALRILGMEYWFAILLFHIPLRDSFFLLGEGKGMEWKGRDGKGWEGKERDGREFKH